MYENPDENRQIHAKCLPLFKFSPIYVWKITPFSWFREFAPTCEKNKWARAWYTFWSGVCVCVWGGGGGCLLFRGGMRMIGWFVRKMLSQGVKIKFWINIFCTYNKIILRILRRWTDIYIYIYIWYTVLPAGVGGGGGGGAGHKELYHDTNTSNFTLQHPWDTILNDNTLIQAYFETETRGPIFAQYFLIRIKNAIEIIIHIYIYIPKWLLQNVFWHGRWRSNMC